MKEIIKIALWAQHTSMAGKVCYDAELIETESDDLVIWEGTREDMLADARDLQALPFTAEHNYRHKVAESILGLLA